MCVCVCVCVCACVRACVGTCGDLLYAVVGLSVGHSPIHYMSIMLLLCIVKVLA